jgi:hypothetical protein
MREHPATGELTCRVILYVRRTSMRIHLALLAVGTAIHTYAQEPPFPSWTLTPTIALTKYFPGGAVRGEGLPPIVPFTGFVASAGGEHRYGATGLNFSTRCFTHEISNVALTFGAGITWYYDPEEPHLTGVVPASANSGIGAQIGKRGFTAYPISMGLQVFYPQEGRESLMFFAGGEGTLQLVSGEVPMGDQAQLGFGLIGGFAVKIFEFGVRYTQFSDIRNLGAYAGFRLNSFSL